MARRARLRVYVETSVVSYLTSRPSRDVVQAARQQTTLDWWAVRSRFDLYVSQLVLDEAGAGDRGAAAERLRSVDGMELLGASIEAALLARQLVRAGGLPRKAEADALHIALAVIGGMDYLLTWNLRHIANVKMRGRIETICRAAGFEPPVICTPEELLDAQP